MVGDFEIFRVVEQCHVDTTAVRGVVMHDLILAAGEFRLFYKVFQHSAVLYFRHSKHH